MLHIDIDFCTLFDSEPITIYRIAFNIKLLHLGKNSSGFCERLELNFSFAWCLKNPKLKQEVHLTLLYSEATLWTYFRLTNAAAIPKKHICVSQYTPHVRYELLMGPLDPVSLGYKILCIVPAILFFSWPPSHSAFLQRVTRLHKIFNFGLFTGIFFLILSSSRTSGFPKWIQ